MRTGAMIGLLGGVGAWMVIWCLMSRRCRLPDRIAPYLVERSQLSSLLAEGRPTTPFPTLEALLSPMVADLGRLLERVGSTSLSVRRRLELAGGGRSVEQFRFEQLAWSAAGLACGLVLGTVMGAGRGGGIPAALLVTLLGAGLGPLVCDRMLSAQVRRRQRRMLTELPAVAELLALAVSAGEGPVAAMERISRTTHGQLAQEVERTLADARAGTPVVIAFERLSTRTTEPAVARFAEAIAVALDRGTPLADVLRAQAQDTREAARRELMETGGKKEISMMVPVVFLVLPVTVLFALFPGLLMLRVGL